MSRSITRRKISLPSLSPGSSHELAVYSFGAANEGKSIYLQAGLHADEHPGLLVLQHLLIQLMQLDELGKINGQVTVVPYANPLGMSQRVFDSVLGRFDLANGENFNRNFPNCSRVISQKIKAGVKCSSSDWKRNFATHLASVKPTTPTATLKLELTKMAMQHDIVLDLHCDVDCVSHLYASHAQQDQAVRLATALNIPVVLLEPDDAGGHAFDNVYGSTWRELEINHAITSGARGFSATIELRGKANIDDRLAQTDAAGLLNFMAQEGIIDAATTAGTDSQTTPTQTYPLVAASHIPCPAAGIVVYKKNPGDSVIESEVIAEVVHLDSDIIGERTPVHSDTNGVLVIRQAPGLVRPGQRLALIASTTLPAIRDENRPLLDA
ncbi:succinylglutamate desuccinylase/aspartoacylase family protein [Pseudomonas jessenii]|uniref:succinylglutamate desuccinylase/aspartoacylase family protein n=1 Tax=Pseudomonas jessenii TaxID=77298 RepID=UPI003891BBED